MINELVSHLRREYELKEAKDPFPYDFKCSFKVDGIWMLLQIDRSYSVNGGHRNPCLRCKIKTKNSNGDTLNNTVSREVSKPKDIDKEIEKAVKHSFS